MPSSKFILNPNLVLHMQVHAGMPLLSLRTIPSSVLITSSTSKEQVSTWMCTIRNWLDRSHGREPKRPTWWPECNRQEVRCMQVTTEVCSQILCLISGWLLFEWKQTRLPQLLVKLLWTELEDRHEGFLRLFPWSWRRETTTKLSNCTEHCSLGISSYLPIIR